MRRNLRLKTSYFVFWKHSRGTILKLGKKYKDIRIKKGGVKFQQHLSILITTKAKTGSF